MDHRRSHTTGLNLCSHLFGDMDANGAHGSSYLKGHRRLPCARVQRQQGMPGSIAGLPIVGDTHPTRAGPSNRVYRSARNMKTHRIRTGFVLCMAFAGVLVPSISQGQYMINMSLVTCSQYLALPPDQSRIFSAWMSGWFNQKTGYTYINLQAYARNVENVKAWCASNPGELLMTGLQRATSKE
jgi:HdeA/HdeB family